jgi:sulfite reductase (NADPH) flavoprotein alpha-component
MMISEFPGPALTDEQWQQIQALATSLDDKQLIWLSGFFAGIEHKKRASLSPGLGPALQGAGERLSFTRNLTVLYGSETGNCAALSAELVERAKTAGLPARLQNMADYKTRQLKEEQDLLVITSTYGEGDPPQPAASFFEFIESHKAPRLPDLRFAVLALGDSTYERYCEAGKRLDRRLEELGGQRLKPRVDCDVDYDEQAETWMAEAIGRIAARREDPSDGMSAQVRPHRALTRTQSFDKRHPFPARISDNIVLTGRGSSKETRHIELSLENSGLMFEPGDALGVMPDNDPDIVEAILQKLDLDASAPVTLKGRATPVGEALKAHFEITALTPRFIGNWADITAVESLRQLSQEDRVEERSAFMRDHHVIDVIRRFPAKGVDAQRFVAGLRPLQPRLYSIASSLRALPDEVHITVSSVSYHLHGENRRGVASGQLAKRGELGAWLPIYVQESPHFRLPSDDAPILMIGAGTGVAPYRAFMQEREVRGASGPSWLVFGERNARTDFLYQTEWQALLKEGVLTRLDVAFSQDGRKGAEDKIYVQHRLKQNAREVFAWLENGAHLYVCGDAARLAPDVHQAVKEIVAAQGGLGPAATDDYLYRLQRDHRYQLDVY